MSGYIKVPFTGEELVWIKKAAEAVKEKPKAFVKELFWESFKVYTENEEDVKKFKENAMCNGSDE